MNTTKVGTEFENKVYEYFSSLLEQNEIPIANKKYSKIFKHKKYKCFGADREIVFDITIETYNPNTSSEDWSSLIVIECKNYKNKVDISDFDEFESKLNKISNTGIKGIFVTTKGFTDNEIQQARNAHIALIIMSETDANWIVSRDVNYKPEDYILFLHGKRNVGYVPIVYNEGSFSTTYDLLNKYGVVTSKKNLIKIPFLNKIDIQKRVNELFKQIDIHSDDIPGSIIAKVFSDYKIYFTDLQQGQLATLSFTDKLITLSNEIIKDKHRIKFTLAHEIGHIVLHSGVLNNVKTLSDYDNWNNIYENAMRTMEIQANVFASYLIVPQLILTTEVCKLFKQYDIHKGYLFLDNQPCNIRDINNVICNLSNTFGVSRSVIQYRLEEEKLLKISNGQPQRIKYLINSFF